MVSSSYHINEIDHINEIEDMTLPELTSVQFSYTFPLEETIELQLSNNQSEVWNFFENVTIKNDSWYYDCDQGEVFHLPKKKNLTRHSTSMTNSLEVSYRRQQQGQEFQPNIYVPSYTVTVIRDGKS